MCSSTLRATSVSEPHAYTRTISSSLPPSAKSSSVNPNLSRLLR
jgi:hypothetical protein